jgi:putative N6-adenine-specific DNA methylase
VTRYFATCARGLEPILAGELARLHAADIQPGRGGVAFAGDLTLVYRANLHLRTAVRVLRPIHEFPVGSPDELYDRVREVRWDEFLTPDHTLAVDCNVRDSALTHSQYAARRVKDAICDQFRDRLGRRPSVDVDQPSVGLNLHVHRDHAVLSLDSSWHSLHKRGYRPVQTRAPLNEALAAGLLLHLGFDGTEPLYDPMCGSGTFLVEGAWIALDRPPGLTRKWFGFYGWPGFDRGVWAALREDARRRVKAALPHPVGGSDRRADAVSFARANAAAAGLGHLLHFEQMDVSATRPVADRPGLMICNPPYGERLDDDPDLDLTYGALGEVVKGCWPGWRLAVFTANAALAKCVRLKRGRTSPFFNGTLQCRLWEYG